VRDNLLARFGLDEALIGSREVEATHLARITCLEKPLGVVKGVLT
jgi:hypothetical protein